MNRQTVVQHYSIVQNNAPKVLANGSEELAKIILKKAKEFNVDIYQNETLASSLLCSNTKDEMPPMLIELLSKSLIWLHDTQKSAQIS